MQWISGKLAPYLILIIYNMYMALFSVTALDFQNIWLIAYSPHVFGYGSRTRSLHTIFFFFFFLMKSNARRGAPE